MESQHKRQTGNSMKIVRRTLCLPVYAVICCGIHCNCNCLCNVRNSANRKTSGRKGLPPPRQTMMMTNRTTPEHQSIVAFSIVHILQGRLLRPEFVGISTSFSIFFCLFAYLKRRETFRPFTDCLMVLMVVIVLIVLMVDNNRFSNGSENHHSLYAVDLSLSEKENVSSAANLMTECGLRQRRFSTPIQFPKFSKKFER